MKGDLSLINFRDYSDFLDFFLRNDLHKTFDFTRSRLLQLHQKKVNWCAVVRKFREEETTVALLAYSANKFTQIGDTVETKSVWLDSFEVGKHLKGLGFGEAALSLFMREAISNKKYLALSPVEKSTGFYKKLGFEDRKGIFVISFANK